MLSATGFGETETCWCDAQAVEVGLMREGRTGEDGVKTTSRSLPEAAV